MIITCPSCATRYLVDPSALGEAGRVVRCARCAHTWPEKPPADMPKRVDIAPPPDGLPPIPPGSGLPALREPQPVRGWAGWAALAAVVALIVAGGVIGREQIMAAWPASVRLYTMVGLVDPLPSQAFRLRNVTQAAVDGSDGAAVSLSGEIVNVSNKILPVPRVSARIIDAEHRSVKEWIVEPVRLDLAPGESAVFTKRIPDGPRKGERLAVSLVDD